MFILGSVRLEGAVQFSIKKTPTCIFTVNNMKCNTLSFSLCQIQIICVQSFGDILVWWCIFTCKKKMMCRLNKRWENTAEIETAGFCSARLQGEAGLRVGAAGLGVGGWPHTR